MSRTLFENSKAALAFAGLILLGAITMVGTSENSGVLPTVADKLAEQRAANDARAFAEQQSVGEPTAPPAVFGDFDPAEAETPQPLISPSAPAQGFTPLPPEAVTADQDDSGVAVITEREMTIAPR